MIASDLMRTAGIFLVIFFAGFVAQGSLTIPAILN